jgi:hypothetical protein
MFADAAEFLASLGAFVGDDHDGRAAARERQQYQRGQEEIKAGQEKIKALMREQFDQFKAELLDRRSIGRGGGLTTRDMIRAEISPIVESIERVRNRLDRLGAGVVIHCVGGDIHRRTSNTGTANNADNVSGLPSQQLPKSFEVDTCITVISLWVQWHHGLTFRDE